MQRLPVLMIANVQLGTGAVAGASYVTPGDAVTPLTKGQPYTTISSFQLNNTSATPRTVTVNLFPPAGSPAAANEIVTTVSVPAAGSAPTMVPSLIGQDIPAGWTLQLVASAATCITPLVSGYLVTP